MDSDEDLSGSGNVYCGEDAFPTDSPSCSKKKPTEAEIYPHEVLTTEEIVQHMVDCIKEVNIVVEIPPTTTRILLNHFKWDQEKLMEKYYDGDQEQLFKEAHVINPFNKPNVPARPSEGSSSKEHCDICLSLVKPSLMSGLQCGHRFCADCWGGYLTTKIMEEGLGQSISCAAHGCDIIVDDVTVMRLVTDAHVKLKYQYLITNSFVECNRLLRWCPAVSCTYAIKVTFVEAQPVTCKCGHQFCFGCGENWHGPVQCSYLKIWLKKCVDDSESYNWIASNTKECPKCKVAIEKNGGCNHMRCKNASCTFEFCWTCLGSWATHGAGSYNCNRYDENAGPKFVAWARYFHYYQRYMNHSKSMGLEKQIYNTIKDTLSCDELQFLKKAFDILCQCRQTLIYTYVFAYYLRENNHSLMFEANQKDLERATENLSEYLEKDITSENLADMRQKIQDQFLYCDGRRIKLLAHVNEGYDQDFWVYNKE